MYRGYYPASELVGTDTGRLTWRVNLPSYAPAEAIGVNARRIGRLARLAGFENLRIDSYAGDTTAITPGINSVGKDGSATASMNAVVTKAKTHNAFADEDSHYPNEYDWSRGTVRLNLAEIDARVGEDPSKLRDPKQWSKELNNALAAGLREAAYKNIVERPSLVSKLRAPAIIGMTAVFDAFFGGLKDSLPSNIEHIEFFQLISDPLFIGPIVLHRWPKERKWSLVPGIQLDRLAAVGGLSKITPLIKEVKL